MGKKKQTIGYWYHPAYHAGLGVGPVDAFLEFRAGDKTAWKGEVNASSTIHIDAPELFGGEKDQGGIVGDVDLMFGEAAQSPNGYLASTFGNQQPAWRGMTTLVWKGGRYGAINPYPAKAAYKIRKIKEGWASGCWYSTKAEILISGSAVPPVTLYYDEIAFSTSTDFKTHVWVTGSFVTSASVFDARFEQLNELSILEPIRAQIKTVDDVLIWDTGWVGNPADKTTLDAGLHSLGLDDLKGSITSGPITRHVVMPAPISAVKVLRMEYGLHSGHVESINTRTSFTLSGSDDRAYAMNPAHILYYSLTDLGGESPANLNSASFTAAADWFYAEGFGLCTSYDPSAETVEDFQQRICRVAGCSLSRSVIDGKWYIDIANGVYTLADLPILADDDILEFSEQPSIPDNAVNSVSVKYFDPEKREEITTPPVQAPALIDAFGTIHQTLDFPEIPTDAIATRVATRELLARITSTRAYPLRTTQAPYAWRPNTYFRLQSPRRGIADMVCILAEKSSGSLKSGAMTISATQDVYSLPAMAYVDVEPGVDTRPDPVPKPITAQTACEAPYVELVQRLDRANLDAMPADAGYLLACAAKPATGGLGYKMATSADGGVTWDAEALGSWCTYATTTAPATRMDTVIAATVVGSLPIGSAALWDDEIVRIDAIDTGAGTVTVGRGCADTVPALHAAGSILWGYDDGAASDLTEYADGESIKIALLTRTGSGVLDVANATQMTVALDSRAARPYPPAHVQVNGFDYPDAITGDAVITWAHRDRLTQADQLVDQLMATIGPETGTTYTVRAVDVATDTETHNHSGITGTTYTVPATDLTAAVNRIEVYSVRDGLESLWRVQMVITGDAVLLDETGEPIQTEDGEFILME